MDQNTEYRIFFFYTITDFIYLILSIHLRGNKNTKTKKYSVYNFN